MSPVGVAGECFRAREGAGVTKVWVDCQRTSADIADDE